MDAVEGLPSRETDSDAQAAWHRSFTSGHRRRLVARLVARFGLHHLPQVEDAVQTAACRAWQAWPRQGVPENPLGWLYVTARRAVIDALRASRPLVELPADDDLQPWAHESDLDAFGSPAAPEGTGAEPPAAVPSGRFAAELDDDELALLFAACDPVLPQATQVALALHAMAGIDWTDVASALLSTPAAIAQRMARARVRLAGHTLRVPAGPDLAPRRDHVLTVLSLLFLIGQRAARSGHAPVGPTPGVSAGRDDGRPAAPAREAAWEAIRLARAVAAHPATAHPDAEALAAMLLLHGARLSGSVDAQGDIVPLVGQSRDRWDAGMIALGMCHLQAAQRASRLSRWHLLAGIAAEHARAPRHDATDWNAIASYYTVLLRIDGSQAPRLAHAIAQVEAGDAAAGLSALQGLLPHVHPALRAHTLAALSAAHRRLGQLDSARQEMTQAIQAAPSPADARWLQRKLADLGGGP